MTIGGREFDVEVGDVGSSPVTVIVDGTEYEVEIPSAPAERIAPIRDAQRSPRPPRRPAAQPRPSTGGTSTADGVVRAPMPGRIVRVNVSGGESVERGQALVVLESMKMENTVASPKDGVVKTVYVSADDSVQHGQSLVELE